MIDRLDAMIGLDRQVALLRRVSIFEHLDDRVLRDLARRMTARRRPAGSIVVGQRETDSAFYVVYAGRAKVALFGENGREMTLAVLGAGDFFGEMSLLDGKPRSANVVAADDCILLKLARDAFEAHLQEHPQTAMALLRELTARLRKSDEVIANLALHDVTARLTRTLLALAEDNGEVRDDGIMLRYRPTQQDLANMVGTCRETVSRTLSAMGRRGLVVARGRSLLLRRALLDSVKQAA